MFLFVGFWGPFDPCSVSPVMGKPRPCQTENVESGAAVQWGDGNRAGAHAKPKPPMTDKSQSPAPLTAHGADPLTGRFAVPGDSVLAARTLLVAALTVGPSTLMGMPETGALVALAEALESLGVVIRRDGGRWTVRGLGVGGLLAPTAPLALQGLGPIAGLLLGALARQDMDCAVTLGADVPDAALTALGRIGAVLVPGADGAAIWRGAMLPLPITRDFDVTDELVLSALLLAGAQMPGLSALRAPATLLNHTENLLAGFGAEISISEEADGSRLIRLRGERELAPKIVTIAGDPALAGLGLVAGLIVPGSELVVEGVLVNPLRTGLIDALLEMGGDITFTNQREVMGEHVADLRVRSSWLRGLGVDAERAALLGSDVVALAVAASFAEGDTTIAGLDGTELGTALAAGLTANRVKARLESGRLVISGERKVPGGGAVSSQGDAALAMGFAVLGLGSKNKVAIDDVGAIDGQFPGFVQAMAALGGHFPSLKGR